MKKENGLGVRAKDLTGERFNRWVVVKRGDDYVYPKSGSRSARWECICDCGKTSLVHSAHLKNGTSQSCGCLNVERSSVHGLSSTKAYNSWYNMIKRCTNPSERDLSYKEKGIAVCESWLESVENFYADMGECPEGFELERLDYTKGYSPENCVWADEQTQAENRGMFSNNTSGKTGVVWSKDHNKWRVYLQKDKRKYEGGLFLTIEAAIEKRKQLEVEIYGYEKKH